MHTPLWVWIWFWFQSLKTVWYLNTSFQVVIDLKAKSLLGFKKLNPNQSFSGFRRYSMTSCQNNSIQDSDRVDKKALYNSKTYRVKFQDMPHFISQAKQMSLFPWHLTFFFRLSISFDQGKWNFWNTGLPWQVPQQYSMHLEHTCWTWSLYFTFLSRIWNRKSPRQMYGYCWGKRWKYIYWWAPWWVLSIHHYCDV